MTALVYSSPIVQVHVPELALNRPGRDYGVPHQGDTARPGYPHFDGQLWERLAEVAESWPTNSARPRKTNERGTPLKYYGAQAARIGLNAMVELRRPKPAPLSTKGLRP